MKYHPTYHKPADCTCKFPEVVLRNGSGHDVTCPVYERWLEFIATKRPKVDPADSFKKGKEIMDKWIMGWSYVEPWQGYIKGLASEIADFERAMIQIAALTGCDLEALENEFREMFAQLPGTWREYVEKFRIEKVNNPCGNG